MEVQEFLPMSMVCQARFPTAVESLDRRGRLLRFVKGALDAHQWEIADTAIRGQTQDEMVTAARWMSRAWGTPPNQIQPPQPKGQTLDEFARTECPNGDQADGNRAARRTAVSATEGWDSELEAAAPDTGSTQAALEEQFPEAFLAVVRQGVPLPARDGWLARRNRAPGNRSFPTCYPVPSVSRLYTDEERQAHRVEILTELGIDVGRWQQSRESTRADKRVFAGPSKEDIAELPHIRQAWSVADHLCDNVGIRTQSGLNAHARYGVLLDWATRDVAQRLARRGDALSQEGAYQKHGLDPFRIAYEHGVDPDELMELATQAKLRASTT
jgi:hypothetical protein